MHTTKPTIYFNNIPDAVAYAYDMRECEGRRFCLFRTFQRGYRSTPFGVGETRPAGAVLLADFPIDGPEAYGIHCIAPEVREACMSEQQARDGVEALNAILAGEY